MIETCWNDFKCFIVTFYMSALVGIIKVTLRSARCNNKVKNLVCFVAYLITKIMKYWEFNKAFSTWEPLRVLQTDRRFRTQRLYGVCLWNINWIESRDACQPDKILFNFVAWNLEDTYSELLIILTSSPIAWKLCPSSWWRTKLQDNQMTEYWTEH